MESGEGIAAQGYAGSIARTDQEAQKDRVGMGLDPAIESPVNESNGSQNTISREQQRLVLTLFRLSETPFW